MINHKTYYTVDFKTEDLIQRAVIAQNNHLRVSAINTLVTTGTLNEIKSKQEQTESAAVKITSADTHAAKEQVNEKVKYNLIGKLVETTGLTCRVIVTILQKISPNTFYLFRANPKEFIIKAGNIINQCKAFAIIQCIKYEKLNNKFSTDILTGNMLRGKLGVNAIESTKSLYDLVVLDRMSTEKNFAESLKHEDDVVVYTKLPNGFYINTPMGKYNPDWAIVFKKDTDIKHVYFVEEFKGNDLQGYQIRGSEESKI